MGIHNCIRDIHISIMDIHSQVVYSPLASLLMIKLWILGKNSSWAYFLSVHITNAVELVKKDNFNHVWIASKWWEDAKSSWCSERVTQWGHDKMAAIFKTTSLINFLVIKTVHFIHISLKVVSTQRSAKVGMVQGRACTMSQAGTLLVPKTSPRQRFQDVQNSEDVHKTWK